MQGGLWFWIGAAGMALGAAALGLLPKAKSGEAAATAAAHTLTPAFAAVFYLLMALGQGGVALEGGRRVFYYARYVDWSITTPLLLIGLSLAAFGDFKGRIGTVGALIAVDVLMIVTGLFAGASPAGSAAKWTWFLVSCGFFLAVYYVIWGPLAQAAKLRDTAKASAFRRNALVLSALWAIYPVLFLAGSDGLDAAPAGLILAAFTVVDLLAKVGYGLMTAREHKA